MRISFLVILVLFITSCGDSSSVKTDALDLMQHGMPIKIQAPADAEIKSSDFGLMKDITVKKDDSYYLQIFSSEAIKLDAGAIMQEKLSEVKQSPYFSKIIKEEEHGFIFEKTRIDSSLNYDFRHVRIQGDNQYIFQTGMIGQFTEKQVEDMYNSVK